MNKDEEMRAKQMAAMQAGQDSELSKMQEQEQKRQEMEERKRVMIRQILEPDALERLNRVGLVKPEKRQQLEAVLLNLAQSGQIQEKMSDGALIQIIEKVDAQRSTTSSVRIQRKRRDDSDDDIDLDNL
mmetsp:Transcript_53536/g.120814  ORF Transcript_53536/g.120814 Transcript_53536/m.120814 type:complete len:129 (-) Transcript_53536:84-470(-)